jgi:hypothetical protein
LRSLWFFKYNSKDTPTNKALVTTNNADTYLNAACIESEEEETDSNTDPENKGNIESNKFYDIATKPNAVPKTYVIITDIILIPSHH